VNFQINVVNSRWIDYDDLSVSIEEAHAALEAQNDGILDDAHTWRDQSYADLVVLVMETSQAGKATVMSTIDASFHDKAFAVVARNSLVGQYTFAHELGHLMGARHDWLSDPADNQPDHANHGYVRIHPKPACERPWRTIMGMPKLCACAGVQCRRVFYWSNPALHYPSCDPHVPGDALGVGEPEPTDDHATLNAAAATVASFRCRP
jgi:hypothetical protein